MIAVGFERPDLDAWFGSVRLVGRIDNGLGLANEEQGRPVWLCTDRRLPWTTIWPVIRRIA